MGGRTKIAVITGAGSGVGRATAITLNTKGFLLVLAGRKQNALEETLEAINQSQVSNKETQYAEVLLQPTDIAQEKSVESLFSLIQKKFGRLDLLFNNAGVAATGNTIDDVSFKDWQRIVSINLSGTFLCTKFAFRIMKKQSPIGGRIINNGSISAHVPRPNSVEYTATKHAITGLTRSTALDGRKFNIAWWQIDIGNASTPMTQRMSEGVIQANGSVSVEDTMDSQNVADAVLYMANLPLNANVPFMTVMATGMPYIGRG